MIPSVSIGITTYNRSRLVARAIDSVLRQDYPALSLIVVDDASTDDTLAVLRQYTSDSRVRIVARERNGGIPVAKNTALDALDGVYGGLLDSDDVLMPGAVRTCIDAFERLGEQVSQVFGHCVSSTTGAFTGHAPPTPGYITYEDGLCDRFGGEHWHLFRLADLGTLRFHPEALTAETYVWHAMLRDKRAYHVGEPLRVYEQGNDDRISTAIIDRRLACGRMMAYRVYLDRFGDDVKRLCPLRFAQLARECAKWEAWSGHRGRALSTLAAAVLAGGVRGTLGPAAAVVLPPSVRDLAYRLRTPTRNS